MRTSGRGRRPQNRTKKQASGAAKRARKGNVAAEEALRRGGGPKATVVNKKGTGKRGRKRKVAAGPSEQAILQTAARYRSLVESSSVGVCESDAETGRILHVNEALASMVGRSAKELVGRNLLELTHPDDLAAAQEQHSRLRRGEISRLDAERRLIHKDGATVWAHFTLSPIQDPGIQPAQEVTIVFDITERKRAEAALQESMEATSFMAEVVRSSQDAIITRTLDGIITSWNQGAERIFGYSSDEVLGQPITILDAEERPGDEARLVAGLRSGTRIRSYETIRRRKDGSVVDVSLTISPVTDKDGRIIGASKIARNITESKRLERELRRSTAELEEADRCKDEFLAMLGHEIRNPLSALVHGLELLGKVPNDPARVDELRVMMTTHSARISHLLDQLLDVARVSSGTMEIASDRVDLAGVIRTAVDTVRTLAASDGHQISLALPYQEAALVKGDAIRLSQVVENLLTNAVKYTEKGGTIDVVLALEGNLARISVRDTGIGMSAEFLPRVFDVFAQEPRADRPSRGGLGLGLALVRRLVELHGGRISASSPGPGQGSEFTITLPRLREKRPQKLLAGGQAAPVEVRPRRILVVDDEKDAARALASILEHDGHQTLVVNDGETALGAMETFEPEVVLLDLGLPGMNGYETAARLRAELGGRRAHLIAVTGYRDDVARLTEAGFDGHLLKPPNLQKLANLLASWDDEGVGAE